MKFQPHQCHHNRLSFPPCQRNTVLSSGPAFTESLEDVVVSRSNWRAQQEPLESFRKLNTQQGLMEQAVGQVDYYPEVILGPYLHGRLPI